jgi:hypothetical protein
MLFIGDGVVVQQNQNAIRNQAPLLTNEGWHRSSPPA